MAPITIVRSALRSRVVRGAIGRRVVDIFADLNSPEEADNRGIFRWVRGLAARLVGFVAGALTRFVGWLGRNIWPIIVSSVTAIANFDWNQSDARIRATMRSNEVAIAASLGSALGSGAVWMASIGLAGAATLKFPVLGGKVALALAEEGSEEIRGQVLSLFNTTRDALVQNTILSGFLTLRRLRLFGLTPVTEDREPWTIAGAIEEKIESIPDDRWRAFVENAYEGALEALIEVGYVVSYAIDDYYASMRIANANQFGANRAVEVQPDPRTEEKFVLFGPQQFVKNNVLSALTTHRFIGNRDVGQIVGQPIEDWVRGGVQRRKLTVVFKSKEKPPWTTQNNNRVKQVCYTIPEPKQGLTWERMKRAAKHYTWGKFRATANLTEGRTMACYGATAAEAERKLKELLELSTCELITLSVSEEKDRHPNLRKESREMYPAYATLLIRRSTAELTGLNDLSGNTYRQETIRVDLWPESEPVNTPLLR